MGESPGGQPSPFCVQLKAMSMPFSSTNTGMPPSEVTIRFNEKLEPAFGSVVVRDSEGKQVDKGDGAVDKKDRLVLRVSLPPLMPGTYKVEWRAVGTDTHKVNGDFTFTVGEQGAGIGPGRMVWLTR